MRYLFPFREVKPGSNVALYGAGRCGKDFYLQVYYSNYCNIACWTDKTFDGYDVEYPFVHTNEIEKYDFDYIVICIADYTIAEEVRKELIERGVQLNKLVWSKAYFLDADCFPVNKRQYLCNWNYYLRLIDELANTDEFSAGKYYQGFSKLGICGRRNVEERVTLYQLDKYLDKSMSVLDIGCNVGFFDLQVASMVNNITGIDKDLSNIRIAKMTADYLEVNNANFIQGDISNIDISEMKANAIFSLAVHTHIFRSGIAPEQYVDLIFNALEENGLLFLESHSLKSQEQKNVYTRLCEMFEKKMKLCMRENYISAGDREITVYRKLK
ncbi:MAG: methyltransferase domain-containing protein [Butyrivibrio sp.]|nr:methyltransferase domain-containing protein [Butyrivibrio sp.]